MSAGEFVGGLLHGATVAHVFHLRTRSYAAHMALGDLYAELAEVADDFAEAYQGGYGLIDDYPEALEVPDGEPLAWLSGFSKWIDKVRKDLPEDSELQNIVDEAQAVVDAAQYKLRFLS